MTSSACGNPTWSVSFVNSLLDWSGAANHVRCERSLRARTALVLAGRRRPLQLVYLLSGYFLLGAAFTDHGVLGADLIMCLKEATVYLFLSIAPQLGSEAGPAPLT